MVKSKQTPKQFLRYVEQQKLELHVELIPVEGNRPFTKTLDSIKAKLEESGVYVGAEIIKDDEVRAIIEFITDEEYNKILEEHTPKRKK